MARISGGTFVIKRALGLDLNCHFNRLVLIFVDIISGVYFISIHGLIKFHPDNMPCNVGFSVLICLQPLIQENPMPRQEAGIENERKI